MSAPTLKDLASQQFAGFGPKQVAELCRRIAAAGGPDHCRLRVYQWSGKPYLVIAAQDSTPSPNPDDAPLNESEWCPPFC